MSGHTVRQVEGKKADGGAVRDLLSLGSSGYCHESNMGR